MRCASYTNMNTVQYVNESLNTAETNQVNYVLLPSPKTLGQRNISSFVYLAGLATHTPASLALTVISACYKPTNTHLHTSTHQTPCSQTGIRCYTRQFTIIYTGLCNCKLSKLNTEHHTAM